MADGIRRRALLAVLLATAIGLLSLQARADPGTAPAAEGPFATSLPDGMRVLAGVYAPPRQPDGNSVLFAAPDGWVVVDSGRHPHHARQLLALADDRGIAALVNSHWHLDHVGGNPALRAAYPQLAVLASPAIDTALAGFLADYADQLRAQIAERPAVAQAADWRAELARIEDGAALRPDRAITTSGEVELGGRPFHVGHVAGAVTGGDLWLLDRERRVLAAGDLVTLPAPFLDTACPDAWLRAVDRLQAQEFDVLVPGHGAPLTPAGLRVWREAFAGLLACAASPAEAAACVDGWLADAAPLLTDADAVQARQLLEYSLPAVLRSPTATKHCESQELAAEGR
jgi:glyoxylase-like metal-dependent hydrolase (beta-lactamase superfamily II)